MKVLKAFITKQPQKHKGGIHSSLIELITSERPDYNDSESLSDIISRNRDRIADQLDVSEREKAESLGRIMSFLETRKALPEESDPLMLFLTPFDLYVLIGIRYSNPISPLLSFTFYNLICFF